MEKIDKDLIIGFPIPEDGDIERVAKREVDFEYFSKIKNDLKSLIDREMGKIISKHDIDIFIDNDKEDYSKVRVRLNLDLSKFKD